MGLLNSIGVSNMSPPLWERYVSEFTPLPAVNQVECNPFFQQRTLRKLLEPADVKIEAYFPLGHGDKTLLENPVTVALSQKYGKNPGQIILRFEVQDGLIVLPTSTNPAKLAGNIGIFDFELSAEEMASIRALDTGRGTHDPETTSMGDTLPAKFKIHE